MSLSEPKTAIRAKIEQLRASLAVPPPSVPAETGMITDLSEKLRKFLAERFVPEEYFAFSNVAPDVQMKS